MQRATSPRTLKTRTSFIDARFCREETKMKRATYLMCCLAIASAAMMFTHTAKAQATDDDKKFLTEASQGSYDEIQLGKLAQQKATNPDVKAFGRSVGNRRPHRTQPRRPEGV
jgi:putative membrane protein